MHENLPEVRFCIQLYFDSSHVNALYTFLISHLDLAHTHLFPTKSYFLYQGHLD